MKKILISLALLMVTMPALAQHWNHGHRHHGHARYYGHYGHNNWVAPMIIGGVVGAAIANRPAQAETVFVQRQPVIVQLQESCTPWKEIQTPDGQTYRERTCTQ
jgi:hypothetical protein